MMPLFTGKPSQGEENRFILLNGVMAPDDTPARLVWTEPFDIDAVVNRFAFAGDGSTEPLSQILDNPTAYRHNSP